MIKSFLKKISNKYPIQCNKIANFIQSKYTSNINLDLCNNKQKRILICYLDIHHINYNNLYHASYFHLNQIIKYFIDSKYCIDVCQNDNIQSYEELKHNNYNIIIGFGIVYKLFCKTNKIPIRINFITENNPEIVKSKYLERITYFKKRHNKIDSQLAYQRIGYFDLEQFKLSTHSIIMTSSFNATSFKPYFEKLYLINSNAIYNKNCQFDHDIISNCINEARNNFLWFGSLGLIHKGLDIVIDTFKDFPNLHVNCYGIDKREIKLFNKLKSKNIHNCGTINVLSDNYYKNVILKHNFIIFPSCSEGMSTAIVTSMAHGIIPIITKECGIEPHNCIFELEDFKIETLKKTILFINKMSNEEILQMRKKCYNYARDVFSLENFTNSFSEIMNQIIN